MSDSPALLREDRASVRILTFNRPETRNTWSSALEAAIVAEFNAAEEDSDVRVIVITGSGDKAFSAGADLKDPSTHVTHSVESFLAEHRAATDPVWLRPVINFSKPLIGAVNGYAVGAGCALAMACDILIASSNADFRFPQSSLGIMPIYGGAARLAQWIGRGLAMEILLTGRALSAHEASLHGLVNRVVEPGAVVEAAVELAEAIAQQPMLASQMTKESLKSGLETEALRSTSVADMYRYLALTQTKESLERHDAWRAARKAK